MKKSNTAQAIAGATQNKLRGGQRTEALLQRAEEKGELRVFVPWAAPPCGRAEPGEAEAKTIDWLFGESSLYTAVAKYVERPRFIIMPADSYAKRNGLDMKCADEYWSVVACVIADYVSVTWMPASQIETQPIMQSYRAEQSYALDKIDQTTARKIISAAEKYSMPTRADVYSAAAQYSMYRAAEAQYVEQDLGALWVSLNWPERDSMCGETPRAYAPEQFRTPWLKEAK